MNILLIALIVIILTVLCFGGKIYRHFHSTIRQQLRKPE
jgi:hypothetical protein